MLLSAPPHTPVFSGLSHTSAVALLALLSLAACGKETSDSNSFPSATASETARPGEETIWSIHWESSLPAEYRPAYEDRIKICHSFLLRADKERERVLSGFASVQFVIVDDVQKKINEIRENSKNLPDTSKEQVMACSIIVKEEKSRHPQALIYVSPSLFPQSAYLLISLDHELNHLWLNGLRLAKGQPCYPDRIEEEQAVCSVTNDTLLKLQKHIADFIKGREGEFQVAAAMLKALPYLRERERLNGEAWNRLTR